MKVFYILSSMISIVLARCFDLVASAGDIVIDSYHAARFTLHDIVMVPFRAVYAATEAAMTGARFVLAAFQLLEPLKPEYRESLHTHGLSLAR